MGLVDDAVVELEIVLGQEPENREALAAMLEARARKTER
jgi:hypothetical protein